MGNSCNKVYRWMDLKICHKNLIRGLGFGHVYRYVDDTEFKALIRKPTRKAVVDWLLTRPECSLNHSENINNWQEASNSTAKSWLEVIRKKHTPEELREALSKRYYVCSLTKKSSKRFKWSDQSKNPKVCLVLNLDKLHSNYQAHIREVRYLSQRPVIGMMDDMLEVMYDIVFTKLRRYSHEEEVRALFCTEITENFTNSILFEKDEEFDYFYDKRLHDYLEEIRVPRTILNRDGVMEDIQAIRKVLDTPEDPEKLLQYFEAFMEKTHEKETTDRFLLSLYNKCMCLPYKFYDLQCLQKNFFQLQTLQRSEILHQMFESRFSYEKLSDLAYTPKYAHVKLTYI